MVNFVYDGWQVRLANGWCENGDLMNELQDYIVNFMSDGNALQTINKISIYFKSGEGVTHTVIFRKNANDRFDIENMYNIDANIFNDIRSSAINILETCNLKNYICL